MRSSFFRIAPFVAFALAAQAQKLNFAQAGTSGFEPSGAVSLKNGCASSSAPSFFSRPEPEGNYKVTVTFGRHSDTTVKAEVRRLMLFHVHGGKHTFIVNVRSPQIASGGTVKLKPREHTSEARAWDDMLTLEFMGTAPSVCTVSVEAAHVPTLYIAGDSTSTDQPGDPYSSWGQSLPLFFKPEIAVANNGESGESARSFFGENRWAKVMNVIKPGDYLFIQFGHNDQHEKDPDVDRYKSELERMVEEARAHGAVPVLITPMNRRTFDATGHVTNSLAGYPEAVRQLARDRHVPLIDLNTMSKVLYEALGPEASGALFARTPQQLWQL